MNRPIFILGGHKSGTSLMRNLLDGVPGIFSIPVETHIFELTGHWVDYAMRRSLPRKQTFEQIIEHISKNIEKSNKKSGRFARYGGDSLLKNQWDIPALLHHLEENAKIPYKKHDLKGFIQAYFESIYLSLLAELPPITLRFVEKSVENAEFAGMLKNLFPEARFIHVVRNPYAVVVSTRKYIAMRGKYPYLGLIFEACEHSYYFAQSNPRFIPNYLILQYEDLILETENKMREVASFIDVPFHESMLLPTALGKMWQGNSVSGKSFNGVSSTPHSSWKNEINPLEVALVNILFEHVLETYGYEKIHPSTLQIMPMKKESLRNYIANRFFWLTSQKRRVGEHE